MNIVFNVRTVIASMMFLTLTVIPKLMVSLGLDLGSASFMLEMWWVFFVVLTALCISGWAYLKNWKTALFLFIAAIVIAYIVAVAV